MTVNPEAIITDESTALCYRQAHALFQDAAINAIRSEGGLKAIDASGVGAIVRFTGETHDVAIKVLAETMAPSGLAKAFQRKSICVNAWTTIRNDSLPDQPPVKLYLNAIRSGRRHLLEPQLTGEFIMPLDTSGEWPKGVLESKLAFIQCLTRHQRKQHPVRSLKTLQDTVGLLANSQPAQFLSTVEAFGEADAAIELIGKEVQQGKDILEPLLQALEARYPGRLKPDLYRMLRERDFSSLHLTNALSQSDCQIEIIRNLTATNITLRPPASWDHLPRVLQVVCPHAGDTNEPRTYSFLDAEGRGLPLTRQQRQLLLQLMEAELGSTPHFSPQEQFDIRPKERDVLLPEGTVLAACKKLVGDGSNWNGELVMGEDKDAPAYHVWLQQNGESFICLVQQPGSGPVIFSFSSTHYDVESYAGMAKQALRQLLLQIYDSLIQRTSKLDNG